MEIKPLGGRIPVDPVKEGKIVALGTGKAG
jgi:hypothetical protein